MVKLNRIYTRTGDDGTTGLGSGGRVSKTDARVQAYGTVDEANAAIGLAVVQAAGAGLNSVSGDIARLLRDIQNDLFDVGADLCCPLMENEKPGTKLRVTREQTQRLENEIDTYNERLSPLDSFVLPGGTPLAAALHLARTIVRRAERDTVALHDREPTKTSMEAVRYLNRLSDLLFVLARVANDDGASDVKWVPGGVRG
jgi:cob(I)alamin adenosyltransferase